MPDGRSTRYTRAQKRSAWKILVEFDTKEIQPICEIPFNIQENYNNKIDDLKRRRAYIPQIPYVDFNGLKPEEALQVYALAKCNKARVTVNRWGDIAGYKLN